MANIDLRALQDEINRTLREREAKNDLTHIRQQVCEYLLEQAEEINEYEFMLSELCEIPEEPEDIDDFKQVLRETIVTMLCYTEHPGTMRHLNNMLTRLL